jgi:hypothetical protein
MVPRPHACVGVLLGALSTLSVAASQPATTVDDPVAIVQAYLAAPDTAGRAAAVARLVKHPDYQPSRLPGWLHRAWTYPATMPGTSTLDVAIGEGDSRRVHLVVPDGYRADRSWPLIYALHPSGVKGEDWARQVRVMLGSRAREFVIAAPDDYKQNYVAARPPFSPEHPAMLDAVARAVHVDANRVYAFGYSKGGFGAWFVALYYADRFAGAVALAAAFDVSVDEGGLWKQVVANVTHLPIYNAWGQRDTLVARDLEEQPVGTLAEQNRRFADAVFGMGLPITNLEVPGAGHYGLSPPADPLVKVLAGRRVGDPRRVSHTFRHLHQASSYWLEGVTWTGDHWGEPRPAIPAPREGESRRAAVTRALEPLLGRLEGRLDGQTIRVTRRHVGDLVAWLGDKTIDWDRPVRVEVDGTVAFEGRPTRDPAIALARAAATMDFDRLRWAGIVVDRGGAGRLVTADAVPGPAWRARHMP